MAESCIFVLFLSYSGVNNPYGRYNTVFNKLILINKIINILASFLLSVNIPTMESLTFLNKMCERRGKTVKSRLWKGFIVMQRITHNKY